MRYFFAIIYGCMLFLTACSVANKSGVDDAINASEGNSRLVTSGVFEDTHFAYAVSIPKELSRWTKFSKSFDGPSYPYFTTPETISNEVTATIYPNYDSSPSPCSPSLTGASTTTPLPNANGTAEWGRVDFWDYTGSLAALDNHDVDPLHDPSPPLCTTPHPYVLNESYKFVTCPTEEEKATLSEDDLQWLPCEQRVRDYEIQHGLNTAYALCSHKDGKTVVICISQMTQNEPLAKQIFDTFRWTK